MQVEIKSLNIKPQLAHGCRSGSRRCSRRCSHWPRARSAAAPPPRSMPAPHSSLNAWPTAPIANRSRRND
jgi:hypothetical protein